MIVQWGHLILIIIMVNNIYMKMNLLVYEWRNEHMFCHDENIIINLKKLFSFNWPNVKEIQIFDFKYGKLRKFGLFYSVYTPIPRYWCGIT